jgi:hypothetical protein
MTATVASSRPSHPLKLVLAGVPAQRILQSVAAGLLGKSSFDGGWSTAILGLVLHFSIASSMSVTYYLVARSRDALYVVVPLSAAASGGKKDPLWVGLSIAVHMFLIGLPMARFTRQAIRASTMSLPTTG